MASTRVLCVYIAVYLGVAIAVALIEAFLIDLPAGGAIAAIIASLFAGQYFVRFNEREPTSQEAWVHSIGFLVCLMLISAYQLLAFGSPIPGSMGGVLLAVVVGYSVIILLATRFIFAKGARGEMKAFARRTSSL